MCDPGKALHSHDGRPVHRKGVRSQVTRPIKVGWLRLALTSDRPTAPNILPANSARIDPQTNSEFARLALIRTYLAALRGKPVYGVRRICSDPPTMMQDGVI